MQFTFLSDGLKHKAEQIVVFKNIMQSCSCKERRFKDCKVSTKIHQNRAKRNIQSTFFSGRLKHIAWADCCLQKQQSKFQLQAEGVERRVANAPRNPQNRANPIIFSLVSVKKSIRIAVASKKRDRKIIANVPGNATKQSKPIIGSHSSLSKGIHQNWSSKRRSKDH